VQIGRNGRRRVVTTLELLQHDLAIMGHKTPPVTHNLPRRSSETYAERPPRQRLGPNGVGFTDAHNSTAPTGLGEHERARLSHILDTLERCVLLAVWVGASPDCDRVVDAPQHILVGCMR
jgi:hypothetical protein